ncbi:hypothetical protein DYB25_008575 [Aphanomyces astaci]|uniref:Uncharacterized protein n=2 Tax=Aphanomyces astaci TaxID=112090 RepID=A0A397BYA9_APHAT|nr:hypothetical protein DYB25_008575 [Aphanomyces astaci]
MLPMSTPSSTPATMGTGSLCVTQPPTKAVQFTTTTTYIFHTALGGSALPTETGPALGLARRHFDIHVADLPSSRYCRRGRVRKIGHHERIDLLKAAGFPVKDIAEFCSEAIDIRQSRAATRIEAKLKRKVEADMDGAASKRQRRVLC